MRACCIGPELVLVYTVEKERVILNAIRRYTRPEEF